MLYNVQRWLKQAMNKICEIIYVGKQSVNVEEINCPGQVKRELSSY